MHDAFSRRGFTRAAILGAAGLCLPRIALADVALSSRLDARATPDGVRATLHLTNRGDANIELTSAAITLAGALWVDGERYPLELAPEIQRSFIRSRAGTRITRRVTLIKDREVAYGTFSSPWPGGVTESAARAAGAELRVRGQHRVGVRVHRDSLAALTSVRARAALV